MYFSSSNGRLALLPPGGEQSVRLCSLTICHPLGRLGSPLSSTLSEINLLASQNAERLDPTAVLHEDTAFRELQAELPISGREGHCQYVFEGE